MVGAGGIIQHSQNEQAESGRVFLMFCMILPRRVSWYGLVNNETMEGNQAMLNRTLSIVGMMCCLVGGAAAQPAPASRPELVANVDVNDEV